MEFQKNKKIIFGRWINYQENEPVQWTILEVKEDKMLVVSTRALEFRSFHNQLEEVTWDSCDLRKWLNSEFLNKAFNKHEQKRILTTELPASVDPETSIILGKPTEDKIFLLSLEEAETYFATYERECAPTYHAWWRQGNLSKETLDYCEGCCDWWLRTPGMEPDSVSFVNYYGMTNTHAPSCSGDGYMEVDDCIGVRPAMWLDITDGLEE